MGRAAPEAEPELPIGGCAARPGIATAAGRAFEPWAAAGHRRTRKLALDLKRDLEPEGSEARRRTCAQRLTGGRSAASRGERSEQRESARMAC